LILGFRNTIFSYISALLIDIKIIIIIIIIIKIIIIIIIIKTLFNEDAYLTIVNLR